MMILKEFSRIVCVSLFSYQGSLLVCLSDSLFTLPHLIDCVKYFFEVFYFSKFKTSNGEGGIWTLAPLLTTYSLSRGAPSASLGTSPKFCSKSNSFSKAERVGFEPTRPCGQTVFKTASLWPLRYLSIRLPLGQRKDYSSKRISKCQHLFSLFLIFFKLLLFYDIFVSYTVFFGRIYSLK